MKVTAATPAAAAADPSHPDHDRWVKETTLAMEVEHAKRVGRSFRQAEEENKFWLERAEARARGFKDLSTADNDDKPRRKTRDERIADRPVAVRVARPSKARRLKHLSPCGRCGTCRPCKREKRVLLISQKAKQGDMKMVAVMWRLSIDGVHAQTCSGRFKGMTPGDANRKLMAELEDICDATVMQMGPWR